MQEPNRKFFIGAFSVARAPSAGSLAAVAVSRSAPPLSHTSTALLFEMSAMQWDEKTARKIELANYENRWGKKPKAELQEKLAEVEAELVKYTERAADPGEKDPEKYTRKKERAGRQIEFLKDLIRQDRPPPAPKAEKPDVINPAHRPAEWNDETVLAIERANLESKWGNKTRAELRELASEVAGDIGKYEAKMAEPGADQERCAGKIEKYKRRATFIEMKLQLTAPS